ncbi:MAG: patatin-like phospholipase family protein [Spirochaetaceae bacterium]
MFGKEKKHKIGVALAAGGAKGIAYIPFLEALDELGVETTMVAGSSIGSVIGGFYAAGTSPKEMISLLEGFQPRDLAEIFAFNWGGAGVIAGETVRNFLNKHLPVTTFEETRIPFRAIATDYWRREQVVFDSGSLAEAIQASAAFPGIFEPLVKDGIVYVDGGAANPLPSDILRGECDFIIGLNVSNRARDPDTDDVPGTGIMMFNTFRILKDRLAEIAIERDPIDVYFRVELPFVETMDFHKYREIIDQAEPEVERFREEVSSKLGL